MASAATNVTSVGGHRMSTVVPADVTGGNVTHGLSNMDLAMKLHYVRGLYCFAATSVVARLSVPALKAPMFPLLNRYYHVAARIRTSANGRPFLKCNDSGLRIIEASCDSHLTSWLQQSKQVICDTGLIPNKVIGPRLDFSPLVFIQFTRFKCGGLAIGFSWSHVIGDAALASSFFRTWSQILAGNQPSKEIQNPPPATALAAFEKTTTAKKTPLSIKQVDPIENCWVAPTNHKMGTYTFCITDANLRLIESKINSSTTAFESISALTWKCLSKIRYGKEPKVVTICRCIPAAKRGGKLSNGQIISTVTLDSLCPTEMELMDLARLIACEDREENEAIEEQIDGESGAPNFVVYGANLTFVNMEELDYRALELKGQRPILANYTIGGVGDEGAVVVQLNVSDDGLWNRERAVNVILPEEEIRSLKHELESVWGIIA